MTEIPGAAAWMPEDPTLEALRSAVQECRGCELYRDATQGVMGAGPTDAASPAPAASSGSTSPRPACTSLPYPPAWVLPTTHPSAVLRSRQRHEDLAAFVADLKVAASAL